MSKIVIRTPSPEAQMKIHKAMKAVRNQKKRDLRCPYCKHVIIRPYGDARGHITTKCTFCKKEVVVGLLNMRCRRGLSPYTARKKK